MPVSFRVGILLAVYEGREYLEELLASIENQNYKNWLLIVGDDSLSNESSVFFLNREAKVEKKILYSLNKNKPLGVVKNFEGLMQSCEENYLMFCDQDDVWHPDKLKIEIEEMERLEALHPGKPILVHSDLEIVDSNLNTLAKSFFDSQRLPRHHESALDQLILNNVTGCTMMMNRAACNLALPIPDEAIMHDWWIAAKVRYHGGIIGFVDQPLVKYRQHGSNVVGAKRIGFWYFCLYSVSSWRSLKGVWAIYRQAKAIDPTVSMWRIVCRKVIMTLRRIRGLNGNA